MKPYHVPIIISLLICMITSLYIVYNLQKVVSKVLENPVQYAPLDDLIKKLEEFANTLFTLVYVALIIITVISIVQTILED